MRTLTYFLAVFVAVSVFQALFVNSPGYPEAAVAAHGILKGAVLYRDIWEMHAPGVFYLWALLFRFFGESLLVQKLAAIAAYSLASAVLFLILRRFSSERKAALASFCYGAFAVLGLGELLVTQLPYNLLFVNIAILFALKYFESKNLLLLVAAGASAGLTAIFKQNTGVYALAGIAISLALINFRERDFQRGAKDVAALTAGFGAVLLPVILFFAFNGAVPDMVYQLFTNNFVEVAKREATAPALTAPIWLAAQALAIFAAGAAFSRDFQKNRKLLLASSVTGLVLLLVAYPRYTDAAIYPAFGALITSFFAAGEQTLKYANNLLQWVKRNWNAGGRRALVTLVIALLIAYDIIVLGLVGVKTVYRTSRIAAYAVYGNFQYYQPNDIALYVNSTLPPDAKVYQFGYNFDLLLSAGRESIKYSFFLPGAVGGRNEQAIIDEIERVRADYVMLDGNAKCEAGTISGIFLYESVLVPCKEYVPKLYGHIVGNYGEVKSFDSGWKLLERNK